MTQTATGVFSHGQPGSPPGAQTVTRIRQSVNFIQNQKFISWVATQKQFRVQQSSLRGWQIAIQVSRLGQHFGQSRLTHASYTCKPDNGTTRPSILKSL